jgi:SAM-dependent methyltransferase
MFVRIVKCPWTSLLPPLSLRIGSIPEHPLPGNRVREGFLLASRRNGEKFAVDLSIEAIRKARARAEAHFSLALAERLPFPAGHFDLVTSVGVMEHFLDTEEALLEIHRILKPGGHYVTLTHVSLTVWERIAAKFGRAGRDS